MHIHVLGDDTIGRQARTYAEYRIFAALTQLAGAGQVRDARVVLRRGNRRRDEKSVTCTVTVTAAGSGPRRVRTTGGHPYAAINRAVERLGGVSTPGRSDGGVAEHLCVAPCPSPCYPCCQLVRPQRRLKHRAG